MDIKNRNFLITGAASGLGHAAARRLIAAGARVIMSDSNEAIAACADTLGPQAISHHGDVTRAEDVHAAVELARGLGGLHGVVHCAGVAWVQPLLDADGQPTGSDLFEKVQRINLLGTFIVLQQAAALMRHNDPQGADGERGVILTVSSITAFDGGAYQCAYASSKAAVAGLTLPAARELGQHGIRVMNIAPGPADTPMLANAPQERLDAAKVATPFPHRLVETEDFARLAESIIDNVMLNGEVIRLDGGIRLR